jgi:hypothetical protein
MKYHSDTLIPHKSAVMSAPANLLAEEVCLPAALLKKRRWKITFPGCSATPTRAASRWRRTVKRR